MHLLLHCYRCLHRSLLMACILNYLDSAGGLPSIHNPNCKLENNPYYSFNITRETDIRITVKQHEKFEKINKNKNENVQFIESEYDERNDSTVDFIPDKELNEDENVVEESFINKKYMNNYHPFSIFIIKSDSIKRLKSLKKDDVICSTGLCKSVGTQRLYASLLPGLYMILIPTYTAGMEGYFEISLAANMRYI